MSIFELDLKMKQDLDRGYLVLNLCLQLIRVSPQVPGIVKGQLVIPNQERSLTQPSFAGNGEHV
jgi:hypothetical protein